MLSATIAVHTAIHETARVAQLRGIFDLKQEATSQQTWTVRLPLSERPWHIGLITGPSGCGKSTIARHFWPAEVALSSLLTWHKSQAIIDSFPPSLGIKDITALLSSVGFSSPPAWLRPFHVLSTGQQFRVTTARLLAEALATTHPLVILDEFTSVVDRTVAQIGSAAIAKTVRAKSLQFIAVTCHHDVIDWL